MPKTIQLRMEGLTCSSCESACRQVLLKYSSQVRTSLLPNPWAEVVVDDENFDAQTLVQSIQDIGFDCRVVERELDEAKLAFRLVRPVDNANRSQPTTAVQEPSQLDQVQRVVQAIPGIVRANLTETDVLQVHVQLGGRFKGPRDVLDAIKSATNLEIVFIPNDGGVEQMQRDQTHEITIWRRRFFMAAILTTPIVVVSMFMGMIPSPANAWVHAETAIRLTIAEIVSFIFATLVQFGTGRVFYKEAWVSLTKRGVLGMSCLIVTGTSVAYFYSVFAIIYNAVVKPDFRLEQFFETSALLITIVHFGKWLESFAKAKTSSAIAKLSSIVPDRATLIRGNQQREEIPIALVQVDDELWVSDGSIIPVDGLVLEGSCSVDESSLTGESAPILKTENDFVVGGTVNLEGGIRMLVTRVGGETTLSRIVKLVSDAQASKAPIERFADYASSRFVPFVIILAVITFVIWLILLKTNAIRNIETWPHRKAHMPDEVFALLFAIAVVVVACPCALGLGAPTAIMVGSGVGASRGLLIKGGKAFECAALVNKVVFDKTGTLTMGRPSVETVILLRKDASGRESTLLERSRMGRESESNLLRKDGNENENESILLKRSQSESDSDSRSLRKAASECESESILSERSRRERERDSILLKRSPSESKRESILLKKSPNESESESSLLRKSQSENENESVLLKRPSNESASESILFKKSSSESANATIDLLDQVDEDLNAADFELSQDLYFLAGSAEQASTHPFARAVVERAMSTIDLVEPTEVETFAGKGLRCKVQGRSVFVGNRALLKERFVGEKKSLHACLDAMTFLETQGMTCASVVEDDTIILGVIGVRDSIRPEARDVLKELTRLGKSVYVMSGDNEVSVRVLANELGIPLDCVYANLLPEEKACKVKEIRNRTKGSAVAFVGDGVNDAVALAVADLGIALQQGTEIATESADVVLVNSNLHGVVTSLDLSRVVFHRIRLNFCFALGFNALAIPIAAGVLYPFTFVSLPPWLAAAIMALSSLLVVASSLSLKRYAPPKSTVRDVCSQVLVPPPARATRVVNDEVRMTAGCEAQYGKTCCCEASKMMCCCKGDCGMRRRYAVIAPVMLSS